MSPFLFFKITLIQQLNIFSGSCRRPRQLQTLNCPSTNAPKLCCFYPQGFFFFFFLPVLPSSICCFVPCCLLFVNLAFRTVLIYPYARQTQKYYIFQWTAKLNFQSVQNPGFICLFTGYKRWILMSICCNKKQGGWTQERGNWCLVCYSDVRVNLLIIKDMHAWMDRDQLHYTRSA